MSQGVVRIIGGKWRSRKIIVPRDTAVRPTPDRVRETVFNWLAPHIVGAVCLDAFAGSGVLGFEALSRGAARVTFVDVEKKVVAQLQQTAVRLHADHHTSILRTQFPQQFFSNTQFDIIFLDPPFKEDVIEQSIHFLQEQQLLKERALIYIETAAGLQNLSVPASWRQLKHKEMGKVACRLHTIIV